MRSIRLSLNFYLALLWLLALIAVLMVLYKTTIKTMMDKEETTYNYLAAQNQGRIQDLEREFDAQILDRARILAQMAQAQFVQEKSYHDLVALTVLTGSIGDSVAKRLQQLTLYRKPSIKLVDAEHLMSRDPVTNKPLDYYQIFNDDGESLQQSQSLGNQSLTLDSTLRTSLKFYEHVFDETHLTPKGSPLRRVTLKVPVASLSVKRSSTPLARLGPAADRPSPLAETPTRVVPFIFFQYAQEARQHKDAVVAYLQDFRFRAAMQEADAAAARVTLMTVLMWIGLGTFAASVVGGFWLISLGLAPLQRLSEAVSQVSERDFRIPFNPHELPIELRPIFDRLTQTLDQLKRAFAREKQAAADISHELRTPLAALLTTLEVGLRRPRSPEKYTELLRDCHAIGRQMTQLVERLLALARIDAGADSLRAQEVDVAALAYQCADLVRPLAEARALNLQLHCSGPARVTTDQNKLREVLTNLLHNAIEYNRPRGRIDVIVERHNGRLHVAVRDTGIGIPAKALDHVFERFYRVDESRQADSLHAGVGLAIVKGYLELMGGSIAVQSTEGEGSTFTVQLPVRPA